VATNLVTLQTCLTSMMGRPITMDQLRQDVGNMVEKITKVITSFRDFRLSMQEYVCLKVVAMLTQDGECSRNMQLLKNLPVLGIRIRRIYMFLGLQDPNP
jgi:nuclear receptor subfamily 6 group A